MYTENYRAAQEEAKFHKLVRFADALPGFREAMSQHMELEPMSPEWTYAVAVRLINLGWFRVGDDRYTRAHKTSGITTLRKNHVKIAEFMGEEFTAKDFRTWGGTLVAAVAFADRDREGGQV
jgi:DNA topoisomerase IB